MTRSIQKQSFIEEKFVTASGLAGNLYYTQDSSEKKEIYLILQKGFYGAHINVSQECYAKNKAAIMDALKSICIRTL